LFFRDLFEGLAYFNKKDFFARVFHFLFVFLHELLSLTLDFLNLKLYKSMEVFPKLIILESKKIIKLIKLLFIKKMIIHQKFNKISRTQFAI